MRKFNYFIICSKDAFHDLLILFDHSLRSVLILHIPQTASNLKLRSVWNFFCDTIELRVNYVQNIKNRKGSTLRAKCWIAFIWRTCIIVLQVFFILLELFFICYDWARLKGYTNCFTYSAIRRKTCSLFTSFRNFNRGRPTSAVKSNFFLSLLFYLLFYLYACRGSGTEPHTVRFNSN
jgi:hypothetical protein